MLDEILSSVEPEALRGASSHICLLEVTRAQTAGARNGMSSSAFQSFDETK